MRLDKYLCDCGIASRSQIKQIIRSGLVTVNGSVKKEPALHIREGTDTVCYLEQEVRYFQYHYYLLHKPAGFLSATVDDRGPTVMDLLNQEPVKDLFPVGRLDKDTEGLLLLTDDGGLAHSLLSPKRKVPKTYLVHCEHALCDEDAVRLEKGVDIAEKSLTAPAKVQRLDETRILLTITEGKYHQVKRMLEAVDNRVVYLKRISMGPLHLEDALEKGKYRPLTQEEIVALKECSSGKDEAHD